jgi:hypothetical protein
MTVLQTRVSCPLHQLLFESEVGTRLSHQVLQQRGKFLTIAPARHYLMKRVQQTHQVLVLQIDLRHLNTEFVFPHHQRYIILAISIGHLDLFGWWGNGGDLRWEYRD